MVTWTIRNRLPISDGKLDWFSRLNEISWQAIRVEQWTIGSPGENGIVKLYQRSRNGSETKNYRLRRYLNEGEEEEKRNRRTQIRQKVKAKGSVSNRPPAIYFILSTVYIYIYRKRHSPQVAQVQSCRMASRGQEIILTLVNPIDCAAERPKARRGENLGVFSPRRNSQYTEDVRRKIGPRRPDRWRVRNRFALSNLECRRFSKLQEQPVRWNADRR